MNLPVDIMFDLFDKMAEPVITYACEVWGFGNSDVLERVHLITCKWILGLKKSTQNCLMYRELGRYKA